MTNDPYRPSDPGQYPPPSGYPPPQHYQPAQYPPQQFPPAPYPAQQYPPPPPPGGYGWYGHPPAPPGPPPRRRTGLIIGLVAGGLALVLCLGGIAVVALRVVDRTTDPAGSDDPFAGTPATSFAEGAAGIELPEADAIGDFTAGEVADTLASVQQALVATRLDPAMLVDRDPEPFIALMSQDNRPQLREAFDSDDFLYFASQFADGAELAVPSPRVDGEITYEATEDEAGIRVIEVVTRFLWAYAFAVPDDATDRSGVVVVRDELVWQVAHRDDVADSSLGLWLWDGSVRAWGLDCTAYDESLLRPQTGSGPSGQLDDPSEIFDPSSLVEVPPPC